MTIEEMKVEVERAKENGVYQAVVNAARAHGLDPAYVLAVCSRESDLTDQFGDDGHAVGPMQVDRRYCPAANRAAAAYEADGTKWDMPDVVDLGVEILAGDCAQAAARFPDFNWHKIAASAYNAGFTNAVYGVTLHGDSDKWTTGGNYGADVMARKALLEQIGVA